MAIYFPGDRYASASTYSAYPDNGTAMFWMKCTNLPSGLYRCFGSHQDFECFIRDISGNVRFGTNVMCGSTLDSDVYLSENVWYHIASFWESDNSGGIYVNGDIDVTHGSMFSSNPSGGTLYFARTQWRSDQVFEGELEDFRIYDREVSASEMKTIYTCRGCDGIVEGLLHRWKMNDLPHNGTSSTAGTIKDVGTSALHADPSNTLTWKESHLRSRPAHKA